jgi:predicted small integral membrane protein
MMTKPITPPVIALIAAVMAAIFATFLFVAPRGDAGIAWTDPMIPGGWMAWTLATATFFFIIACLLVTMTVLAINYPETPRRGVLRIDTTRGDRLFISLLGSGFICIAYLGLVGTPLWGALVICLIYAAAVFRWV